MDDIHARVGRLEQASAGSRLTALETWKQKTEVDDAGRKGEWDNMKEKLTQIQGTLSWLNRLIIGGIATGFVLWMMRGGFSVPPL